MRNKGQAISEYPLILVLAVVVTVGALSYLGTEIVQGHLNSADKVASADKLYGLLDANAGGQGLSPQQGGSDDNAPVGAGTLPTASALAPTSTPPATMGGPGSVNITTASGLTISFDNYPTDLGEAVETAGANGTTEMVLANLEQMIVELEDAGEIDAAEANNLQKLANQGHYIASIEKALEAELANTNPSMTHRDLMDVMLEFDGQTVQIADLAERIGFFDNLETRESVANLPIDAMKNYRPGTETKKFLDLYESASNIKDPAVKHMVEEMATEIMFLSEVIEHSIIDHTGESLKDPKAWIVSDTTHYDSGKICAGGGGQDTGVHCP